MGSGILTLLIFTPLIGALFVLMQSGERAVWNSAFIFSLLPLAISCYLFRAFDPSQAGYQFAEQYPWIPQFGISYHLGMDGISLVLVMLTTILISLSLLYSGGGDIDHRPREFCFFMLALETGLLGTLLAVDLFMFYVFWELMLFPMYFLIGIWGHGRPIYAAVKFVLYTMIGSFLMLAAIIYLVRIYHSHSGAYTFDLPTLYNTQMTATQARWMFAAFALAFAIKVPMWPVHTWLPDAHTNAPTAGSVILAGVMLKMGTYGFLRFAIPLFPAVAIEATPLFMALAVVGIIYGALVAMVQPDLKKLIAYSSVSHLGFVMLGIFAFNLEGIDGAVYQMLNHGISTGALFLLVGMIYMRRHTREISEYGGLWHSVPIYAAVFMFAMLSSIGLPGLNGFVGEFLIMLGSYMQSWQAVAFAVTGVILGALYMLWTYERVMFGPITKKVNETIRDLNGREIATMVPLMALMVVMGLYPKFIIDRMEPSIAQVLSRVHSAQARMDEEHRANKLAQRPGDSGGSTDRDSSASLRSPQNDNAGDLGRADLTPNPFPLGKGNRRSTFTSLAPFAIPSAHSSSVILREAISSPTVILRQAKRGGRISTAGVSLQHPSPTPSGWLESSNDGDDATDRDSSASLRSPQNDNGWDATSRFVSTVLAQKGSPLSRAFLSEAKDLREAISSPTVILRQAKRGGRISTAGVSLQHPSPTPSGWLESSNDGDDATDRDSSASLRSPQNDNGWDATSRFVSTVLAQKGSPLSRAFLSEAKDLREAISPPTVILRQAKRGGRISTAGVSLQHPSTTPSAWLECSNDDGDNFTDRDSSASLRSPQNDNGWDVTSRFFSTVLAQEGSPLSGAILSEANHLGEAISLPTVILRQAERGGRISTAGVSLQHPSTTPSAWLECSNGDGDNFTDRDSSASLRSPQNDNAPARRTRNDHSTDLLLSFPFPKGKGLGVRSVRISG